MPCSIPQMVHTVLYWHNQIIRQIKIQFMKLYVTNLTHCTYCTVLPKQIIHQLKLKLQNCTGKADNLSVKDAMHATFNLTNSGQLYHTCTADHLSFNLTHCTYCTVLAMQIIHQLNLKLQNCTGEADYLSVKDVVHATFNPTNCTILAQQIIYHSI